jgi:hypothetical protein
MLSVAAHCQKFLSDSFVLPENNVIIKAALDHLNLDSRETVVNRFKRPAPGTYAHSAETLEQNATCFAQSPDHHNGCLAPDNPALH